MGLLGSYGLSLVSFVPFIIIIAVLIFIHELGHFLVARWCGVKVMTFSIGFGPELVGFDDRKGTHWRVAAFPLGGYVRFFGDANAASLPDAERSQLMTPEERAVSLYHKPVWQRIAVVAAGPIANFILAFVILTGCFSIYGYSSPEPFISGVEAGGPAAKAGFKIWDRVVSIDGQPVVSGQDISRFLRIAPGGDVPVVVERAGQELALKVTPQARLPMSDSDSAMVRGYIGVKLGMAPPNLPGAALASLKQIGYVVEGPYVLISGLLSGHNQLNQVSGAIGIADATHQLALSGEFYTLVLIAGFLSASLGLFNLLPIPILDGGHLLFYFIEALRGRPLTQRTQEAGFGIGFVLIITLTVLVLGHDLARIIFPG